MGASVARHNYKKILVEKTSTFIGNNRNSGTQENRNAGQGYGSDIKYLTFVPLKNKTGKAVANALKEILAERGPTKMWVDKGKECYNKDVQGLVELYSTENEEKSCVVERWNRTMKEKMWKYFTANSTRVYIDVLDNLVQQ